MKTANYNVRLDPIIKAKAEKTFATLGLSLSEAINIFLHKSILEYGFPFEVKYTPNTETFLAIQEADDIVKGRVEAKIFATPEELFAEWKKEDAEEAIDE